MIREKFLPIIYLFKYFSISGLVPTTWRFLPLVDPKVQEFHCRDLDSIPSIREFEAVKEFSSNNSYQFHLMRDHRWRISPFF